MVKTNGRGSARAGSKRSAGDQSKPPMASVADRHVCYQLAVQAVEPEIDFIDDTFRDLRGRRPTLIREDFAGTANSACEFVKRRRTNRAIAVDLDQPTLDWGVEHNVGSLTPHQQKRITLVNANVLDVDVEPVDAILAMNFSYFCFETRDMLRAYFRHARETLVEGGIFFLDCYGGYESFKVCTDKRQINKDFAYIWDQASYDPVTGFMQTYIHFHFADGSKMRRAFSYRWRMWTLPEIREVLTEAGFERVTVYWEGTDEETGEGDGVFEPAEHGDADPAWICYITAER